MRRRCLGCGRMIARGSRCSRCTPPSPSSVSWRGKSKVRDYVLQRDGGCVVCGATENPEVHHVVGAARGGPTVPSNLETRCRVHHKKGFDEEPIP